MTDDQHLKEHLWLVSNVFTVIILGTLEDQGITFDGKTCNIPVSRCFKYKGHNPFSGNLRYKCSRCEKIILVDPMDVLADVGFKIITDVREKRREKSFFEWFFLIQDDYHESQYTGRIERKISRSEG
jgi:hypothetical protein